MAWLDVLVGFSLIMLVFASAVSVAQTMVKRLFSTKGRAIVGPLVLELERQWKAGPLARMDPSMWADMKAKIEAQLRTRRAMGIKLAFAHVEDPRLVLGMLRDYGMKEMADAAGGVATLGVDAQLEWQRLIERVEGGWDSLAGRLSSAYVRHTRISVFILSCVAAFAFNVDAIRILRVLSVNPQVRTQLATRAEDEAKKVQAATSQPADPTAPPTEIALASMAPSSFSQFQRENLDELRSTGLPLGWETAPLSVCDGPTRTVAVYGRRCGAAGMAFGATLALWLMRLLGLLVGAGLIAQGAPFWYSILDEVLGLKKKMVDVKVGSAHAYGGGRARGVGGRADGAALGHRGGDGKSGVSAPALAAAGGEPTEDAATGDVEAGPSRD